MANNYFKFKQFQLLQDKTAMKVGTDGVLLGAWANCSRKKQILDIGAGTGLISIMLAQRSEANIFAVEIEENAYKQAVENINACRWKERIQIFHTSFQQFASKTTKKFDLIVCNPPFFTNSLKANTENRTLARHNHSLPFAELIAGVSNILAENACFCLIIPSDLETKIQTIAQKNGLFCAEKLNVKPTPTKPPKRVLMNFSHKKNPTKNNFLTIEIGKRHEYSHEYMELTKDFYLKF